MIELSISNKEQTRHIGNFTLYSFNTLSGASPAYSTPKLIPQVFNWVEVWTHGRPFHFLYSHILEVVCDNPGPVGVMDVILEDGVRSQIVEIWDHPRPQPN